MNIFLIEQEYDVEPNSSVCSAWSTRELAREELKRLSKDMADHIDYCGGEDHFKHNYGRIFISEIPLDR